MRRAPFLPLFALLLWGGTGCDAMGGSTASIVEPPPTFRVVSRTPGPGREGVPTSVPLAVTFDGEIDPASVDVGAITANGSSFGTLAVQGSTLTFVPTGGWTPGTPYAIAISPGITGRNGVPLGPVPVWGFKTAGVRPVVDTILQVRARPR